jgi:N-acetylmuramoyl-L-alanine amidase
MPSYTAKDGETLADIAIRECGLVNLASILSDAQNKALFTLRPDQVLHQGDIVALPEREAGTKEEKLEPEMINEFETDRPEPNLVLQILDRSRKPRAGVKFQLILQDGRDIKSETDGDGKLQAGIPYEQTTVSLAIGQVRRTLAIGQLKSGFSVEGIQARLNNLGYEAGLVDGNMGLATSAAIRRFQKDNGLNETGEVAEALWNKLQEVYGE